MWFVVISVNASTTQTYTMDQSNKIPSLEDTINAVSDTQLHRANSRTLDFFKKSMQSWVAELSTTEKLVEPYFIELNFKNISQAKRRLFFNQIPASLSLDKAEVDELIKVGRELLLTHPEFQRLIQDMR